MGCAWYFVGSADGGWVSRSGVDRGPLMHRYATCLGKMTFQDQAFYGNINGNIMGIWEFPSYTGWWFGT